ncbi:MAG: twin-arginine translocation pathway signal protein [Hyphomicrobiales bacterium]|nr:MAG: twin-arginine translocation pathway signal protein [Hyphomicrobiales bacterium]
MPIDCVGGCSPTLNLLRGLTIAPGNNRVCGTVLLSKAIHLSRTSEQQHRRRVMKKYTAILLAGLIAFPASMVMAGEGSGTFAGASGHATAGHVQVINTGSGWEVHLKDDFSLDGAPDPRVGFGSSGKFADATDFEPLRSLTGTQVYKVPATLDPTAFDEVYIWCRRYSVPLGVAKLTN